ncbi:unnamed protein product [Euphydryas editha]|nr:unnamed protein product [Euphydryas editha]
MAMKTIDKYKMAINNVRNKFYGAQKKYEQEIMKLQVERDKLETRQELLDILICEVYSDCKIPTNKQLIKKLAIKIAEKTDKDADRKLLGLHGQIRLRTTSKDVKRPINEKIQSEIDHFFNRNDITRYTSGKKETRTRNKTKMQIR